MIFFLDISVGTSRFLRRLFKFLLGVGSQNLVTRRRQIDPAVSARWDLVNSNRLAGMSLQQKASVATIETVLHGLLARHDRMFMSNSIEGRPPLYRRNHSRTIWDG